VIRFSTPLTLPGFRNIMLDNQNRNRRRCNDDRVFHEDFLMVIHRGITYWTFCIFFFCHYQSRRTAILRPKIVKKPITNGGKVVKNCAWRRRKTWKYPRVKRAGEKNVEGFMSTLNRYSRSHIKKWKQLRGMSCWTRPRSILLCTRTRHVIIN